MIFWVTLETAVTEKELAGLRFECSGCGDCCRSRGRYAHVYVNDGEQRALARHLDMSPAEFRAGFTFVDEDDWVQLTTDGEACCFLDRRDNRCLVYDARPVQCRTFPFWRDLVGRRGWRAEAGRLCEGVGEGEHVSREQAELLMAEKEKADGED